MTSGKKVSVVLVDDSTVIRGAISRILQTDPEIEIVSSVPNGEAGISMARSKRPDVIILDVEMPVMDGLTALPTILEVSPNTKVVMCSSLTAKGADTTMKALALGAVECIVKPSTAQETSGAEGSFKDTLLKLVRSLGGLPEKAAGAVARPPSALEKSRLDSSSVNKESSPAPIITKGIPPTPRNDAMAYKGKPSIIAIGSSTGGPQALFTVLKDVGTLDVPIVITQHMPATFTKILANHIQQQTGLTAYECEHGMAIEKGSVYVAPGGKHMLFELRDGKLYAVLDDGPSENFCKPAVDPMMRSLIDIYGQKIFCAILTGMGQDGLKGAAALVEKGGRVIAQDEATSVVWGMPGAVAQAGLCSSILPVNEIGASIRRACLL